jgi:GNAT superfamily N-acetyltransferase
MPELSLFDYDTKNPLHKEKFGALNREWLERYFRVEVHDSDVFADPEGKILAKGGVILLAAIGNNIIGTGSLQSMEKDIYEIAKMAVTEQYQAQGIGERILQVLIERANMMKAKRLYIISNTKLERAIRLYRKHGFKDSLENRHSHYERGDITLQNDLLIKAA